MNPWLILVVAGLFEVGFTTCMKLSEGFSQIKYQIGIKAIQARYQAPIGATAVAIKMPLLKAISGFNSFIKILFFGGVYGTIIFSFDILEFFFHIRNLITILNNKLEFNK